MKKLIPNFITLLNLTCGLIAILFASQNQLEYAAYFVFLGIFFDFLDGFAARLLKVESSLGAQLDSLSDMITCGVVPGIVMFQLLCNANTDWTLSDYISNYKEIGYLPFFGILISLAAAYRLANFNLNNRQSENFRGLPTPAFGLLVLSLPLIKIYGNYEWAMNLVNDRYFLIVVSLVGSILMNTNISLFSLKFSDYSFRENWIKYLFLVLSLLLLIILQVTAIPILIILYILLSLVQNSTK